MAKFCTKCGRKLEEGEVCFCVDVTVKEEPIPEPVQQPYQQQPDEQTKTKEAEWIQEKTSALVSGTKNMFAEILPILKAPVTRMQQLAGDKNSIIGMEFIIAKGIISLILVLIVLSKISSLLGSYIKLPYGKAIIMVLLFTVGADFLEALLLKVITAAANGATTQSAMITVVGTRGLYESIITIIAGILALVSFNAAIIVYFLCISVSTYIQYSGYQATVKMNDDRKPYIFFIVKACLFIIIYIVLDLMLKDLLTSSLSGISDLMRYL